MLGLALAIDLGLLYPASISFSTVVFPTPLISERPTSISGAALISVGGSAAYLWSLWALLFTDAGMPEMRMSLSILPGSREDVPQIYLEVASAVTTFLLAGRYFEARAKRQSAAALRAAMRASQDAPSSDHRSEKAVSGSEAKPAMGTANTARKIKMGALRNVMRWERLEAGDGSLESGGWRPKVGAATNSRPRSPYPLTSSLWVSGDEYDFDSRASGLPTHLPLRPARKSAKATSYGVCVFIGT